MCQFGPTFGSRPRVDPKFLLYKEQKFGTKNKKSETRRRRLKGIHSRPDTNKTGAEGLSFYYPRLLHCLDQILAVMSLSQHRVSSSKTVRLRAPCGARCIGNAVSTWSAVCSEAPHSQFGEGARPHLRMDEWNRPTPVRRRLTLTQAARGKPIPTGLALVSGTKPRSLEAFSQYSAFHLWFFYSEARMPSLKSSRSETEFKWQLFLENIMIFGRKIRNPRLNSKKDLFFRKHYDFGTKNQKFETEFKWKPFF